MVVTHGRPTLKSYILLRKKKEYRRIADFIFNIESRLSQLQLIEHSIIRTAYFYKFF